MYVCMYVKCVKSNLVSLRVRTGLVSSKAKSSVSRQEFFRVDEMGEQANDLSRGVAGVGASASRARTPGWQGSRRICPATDNIAGSRCP